MSSKRRRRPARRVKPEPRRPAETVEITKIAQQGDGEGALTDATRIFVPLTLPGDVIRAQPGARRGDGIAGSVLEWIEQTPRKDPICNVYGSCGGCQLQHVPAADYESWKSDAVRTALARHGLSVELSPLRQVPLNARRRATLSLVMTADGPVLGFNGAYSDRVIGMDGCPLLAPALADLWVPIRDFCASVFAAPLRADIRMTAAQPGSVEIVIATDRELDLGLREAIAAFSETHDFST